MSLFAARPDIIHHLSPDHLGRSLRADVRAGLSVSPKTLPPKWFYDERGSELFERITSLPEYYPTRAEREVLELHAAEIAIACPAETLIELGSGSSRKTPLLLNALKDEGSLRRYVGVDISDSALLDAQNNLAPAFPDLELQAVTADFETQLHLLPRTGRRMVALLGSTIGNFEPSTRASFFSNVRDLLGKDGGSLLLGTDLVKSPDVLVSAYADAEGITADFNRNVLRVLNTELGANFDVMAFEHVAVWRPQEEWIEMRLRASRPMLVHLPEMDMSIQFHEGEELRTEISAKFRLDGVVEEMEAAGFSVAGQWTDPQNRFALTLAAAI
jgi:L-histidine N-alpha-methyltransferase